jgi:glucokinase
VNRIALRRISARFTDAFKAKEPYADLMRSIPVGVVLNPRTALLGAARLADRLMRETAK